MAAMMDEASGPVGSGTAAAQVIVGDESARLLIERIRDYAIYMLDVKGNVLTWNEGARLIKGFAADEVIGRHYSMFFTAEEREAAEPDRELLAAVDSPFEIEGWRLRKGGAPFWADVVITALRDDDGVLRGFAKITRDLTERRRREEDRVRLARAEHALLVCDELFRETRSRLNTTVTTLRVHIDALRTTVDTLAGGDVAGKLQMLNWGIDRMTRSIDDVLSLARSSAEQLVREARDSDRAPDRQEHPLVRASER